MSSRRLACALALICLPLAAHAQTFSGPSTWGNDHAKLVIQSIDATGRLSGTYTNTGPGFGCANRAFPITGWVDGDKVAYVVHRQDPANCTPIQSFSGFQRDGELLVEFMALYTENGSTRLIKGDDRYRKQ